MKPPLPSPDTPQRQSSSRCRDRKSIENYLKSKYPDSTFDHLKSEKSSAEGEDGVESKSAAAKSKEVKANQLYNGKQTSPTGRRSSCSSLWESDGGDSKHPESSRPIKMRESNLGVALKNERRKPRNNNPKSQNFCDPRFPVSAISKSVHAKDRTYGKQSSSVTKLSKCDSAVESRRGYLKNRDPPPPTEIRQTEVCVGLKKSRGRLRQLSLEPQNSSSPVTALPKSVEVKGRTDGQQSPSITKLNQCRSSVESRRGAKNRYLPPPTDMIQKDVCVGLKKSRRRLRKHDLEPQNVHEASFPVTAHSKSVKMKDRANGKRSSSAIDLCTTSSPLLNKRDESKCSESINPTKVGQSDVAICVKNTPGRMKKNDPEPQNVSDSSSPDILCTRTHCPTSKTAVNDMCLEEKPQNVNNNGRLLVDTRNASDSSSTEIVHHSNSEKPMHLNLAVVRLKRMKDALYDTLNEYGFISASRAVLEMGLTPNSVRTKTQTKHSGERKSVVKNQLTATPSKSLKSGVTISGNISGPLSNDTERGNEMVLKQFLGIGSSKKASIRSAVLANRNHSNRRGNRSRNKESSKTKDYGCEFTEKALTSGTKKLEVRLHDFRLNKQCVESKTVEDRRSKLKELPVRQSLRYRSKPLSSIQQSENNTKCTKPRIPRGSKNSSKKRKSQLSVAKDFGKVDDLLEILDSDEEQINNAVPIVMQPMVMQQIVMQQIVMQPIIMHNFTYQQPRQDLRLVSNQVVSGITNNGWPFGWGTVGSKKQYADTVFTVSSGESSGSSDSENEKMVQSLITKENDIPSDPGYSELQDICYISEKTSASSNIELKGVCYISEGTKPNAPLNGGGSAEQLNSLSEKQRPNSPDAAVLSILYDHELPSDCGNGPSNQEKSFTKNESSSSFLSNVIRMHDGSIKGSSSPMPPNECDLTVNKQSQTRTLDGFIEENNDSCKQLSLNNVLTKTINMESSSQIPLNEDNSERKQALMLSIPDRLAAKSSLREQNQGSCSELPSNIINQEGGFNSKEGLHGLPSGSLESEIHAKTRSPLFEMASDKQVKEELNRPSANEVMVCKLSLSEESCKIALDIRNATIQEESLMLDKTLTTLEGTKEVQTRLSTPQVSVQKPSFVEESGETCSKSLSNQNPSISPSAPIEDMDVPSNESANEVQCTIPEVFVENSPVNEENNEFSSKFASDQNDPSNQDEGFNAHNNVLIVLPADAAKNMVGLEGTSESTLCEMGTGDTVENQIQPRSPISGEKLSLDDENKETSSELSSDDDELTSDEKGFTEDENRATTSADSVENNETPAGIHKVQHSTSASLLSNRKMALDADNSDSSSELSSNHGDVTNQEISFSSDKNPEFQNPVENTEGIGNAKKNHLQPLESELSVEELSFDEESRESDRELTHNDVTNKKNYFHPLVNESAESPENLDPFSPVESLGNMEALGRTMIDKLQPCTSDLSIGEPLPDEESMESGSKSPLTHNDVTNQENGFNRFVNHTVSPPKTAENPTALEETIRCSSDEILLSEGAKEVQAQPNILGGSCKNNPESFSNESVNEDEGFNLSENCSVSPESVENINGHDDAFSEISSNHDTTEEEFPPTREAFDEEIKDFDNKLPLNHDKDNNQDESFAQVSLQSLLASESVENVEPVGGVASQISLNEDDSTTNEPIHSSEQSRSSPPNVSNVTKLVDEANKDIFTKPSPPSSLDDTIQGGSLIPEKTSRITLAEPTEKLLRETEKKSFNQVAINCDDLVTRDYYCLSPGQCKPSNSDENPSLDELCRFSFKQVLASEEASNLEEHFASGNGFLPSPCKSIENTSLQIRSEDTECPYDSVYWEDAVAEEIVYDENGFCEGTGSNSEKTPLGSNLSKRDPTLEYVHENTNSVPQDVIGSLIDSYHSPNSVDTERGDTHEKSLQIDNHLSRCNSDKFQDQEKESVKNTSFSENTFFRIDVSPVGPNVGFEEINEKCSLGNQPADFLDICDYTEALVDACLRENLPEECIASMQVVESANFPSVPAINEIFVESVKNNGQSAETGVTPNLPVEFANECLDRHHSPKASRSADGNEDISSQPGICSQPTELIFDGFFYDTNEPINIPTDGDLATKLSQYSSMSEETQSTLPHKLPSKNDSDLDRFLNTSDQETNFPSQLPLKPTVIEEVHLSFEPSQPASSNEIADKTECNKKDFSFKKFELNGEVSIWQSTRDISLNVISLNEEAVDRFKERIIVEEKQPINLGGELSSKVNDLLFDEEFEPINNATPKSTRLGKRISLSPSVPVSYHSDITFDEEFESSNHSTPGKKIRLGPSVTVSRVRSRTSSAWEFDEEFEHSNNITPVKKQMNEKCILRAPSPQEVRMTSLGPVDSLVIDENDDPPLNATADSVNEICVRSVSRDSARGYVVISSDEESESPPFTNYPGFNQTNSATPINRPTMLLSNKAKTSLHDSRGKSMREPIVTSSPRKARKSKGRHPSHRRMTPLSSISEEVGLIDLSDTESESEPTYCPPRKISKLSARLDLQTSKKVVSCSNRLKDGGEENISRKGNHNNQRQSEMYWSHCLPIEPDDVKPIDLDDTDSEIDFTEDESRKPLSSSPCAPEKSNVRTPVGVSKVTRNLENVVELTESDSENAPNRVTGISTDFLDEFIESDDSFKAEENDQARNQSLIKPLTKKPLLSSQRQEFIKNYSQELVKLAETIYRKNKTSPSKKSHKTSQPTHKEAIVVSDSEHSSVGDFIESDHELCSGEENVSVTSPSYSLFKQSLMSIRIPTASTIRPLKVVSAMQSNVEDPTSSRLSLKSFVYEKSDNVRSGKNGSTDRYTSSKLSSLSNSPLPMRILSVSRKPTVIHRKNTPSRSAAPPNLAKKRTLSTICRGIALDDKDNRSPGSNIRGDTSRITSPDHQNPPPPNGRNLRLSNSSAQLQAVLRTPATSNQERMRTVNCIQKPKSSLKEKIRPSSSQQLHGGDGRLVSSKSLSAPESSRKLQNLLGERATTAPNAENARSHPASGHSRISASPASELALKMKQQVATVLQQRKLPEDKALESQPFTKLVSTTPARDTDSDHDGLSDISDHDNDLGLESDDDSCRPMVPDFLSSKLVLSRQSLNFLKTVTQKRSKSPVKPPAPARSSKNLFSASGKACRENRSFQPLPKNDVGS